MGFKRSSFRAVLGTAVLVVTGCCFHQVKADLVLIADGKSLAPVIIYEGAPPRTVAAAEEFVDVIEKISGVRPELKHGIEGPVPGRAIWIGYQPILDELFPEVDFELSEPEEILLLANEHHLVIAGRDRWREDGLTVPGAGYMWALREEITGVQLEYGTVNAIYTFLQDILGVRWLWPGELGESIIEQSVISVAPFEYRYAPPIRSRAGVFWRFGLHRMDGTPGQKWANHQRLLLDSLELQGGHGFGDWFDKFHADHPEYFALQPDGTRSGFPSPRHAKICSANPAVWKRWLEQVAEIRRLNPNQRVFLAASNDGWAAGHCVCEDCRAWDHPQGEYLRFSWQGISQSYVALSDREVTFANTLARLLRERYPDEELYVQIHGYGLSRPVPVEAVPDDNVIISSVSNFLLRDGDLRETAMGQYDGWAGITENLMWRPNLGRSHGWHEGLPRVPLTAVMDDMDFIARRGTSGIYLDTVPTYFWATQGPLYYLLAQLTWNPSLEGQAVMADYFERAYGPAAPEMAKYWQLFDARVSEFSTDEDLAVVFSAEFLDSAQRHLDQAATIVSAAPGKYAERIELVRTGLEYTRLAVELRTVNQQLRSSGQSSSAQMDRARLLWQEIQDLVRQQPLLGRPPANLNPSRR